MVGDATALISPGSRGVAIKRDRWKGRHLSLSSLFSE
jgi:hypothetical protein